MSSNAAVLNAPPVMRDDEEAVENGKGKRWHGEEVHRDDVFPVIDQKCGASLCRLRAPRRFPYPAQDSSFRDVEAQHRKLSMDARSTQVGFSATMRKMSSLNSVLTHFRLDGLDAARATSNTL